MNKNLYPLFGMMPAMNTPFTENDDIDFEGLQKHIDNAIASGVCGFMIPVVASEVNKLTNTERQGIIQAAIEANNHRVIMIGGASSITKEECLQNIRHLLNAGVDCILANIPYENDIQYEDYVKAIAALEPSALMIQDFNLNGAGVPVELIVRLFNEIECFRCIKVETLPAGPKYTAILKATDNHLNVSGGWSVTQIIDAWDRGVHAMANTGLHEIYCKIYELYKKDRRNMAVSLYEKLQPILAFSNQYTDISIHFFKHLLHRQGIFKTPRVRQPILEYDSWFRRIGDEMIEKAIVLTEKVKSGLYDSWE
jgi:4-hydroxy-tetrahydrodipicolinate synthase